MYTRRFTALCLVLAFVAGLNGAPVSAADSVQPFRDGQVGFPEMAKLIGEAHDFIHIAAWGFDDEMRWSATGPRPPLYSRVDKLAPAPPPENLQCLNGASRIAPADTLYSILRCKASQLALNQERGKPMKALLKKSFQSEVMVLVWDQYLDINADGALNPPLNNLNDIVFCYVPIDELLSWTTPQALHDQMRVRGSGASMPLLLAFQNYYANNHALYQHAAVEMPTGIQVQTQRNLSATPPQWTKYAMALAIAFPALASIIPKILSLASHHQKLIVTETGAFVGGLNTFKEYWDDDTHAVVNKARWTSGDTSTNTSILSQPGWGVIPQPLHDTGSIVRGDVVSEIDGTFDERWDTNANPAFVKNARVAAPAGYPALTASTPYHYLKVVVAEHAQRVKVPAARINTLLSAIARDERPMITPHGTNKSVADPLYLTKGPPTFVVSQPPQSYQGSAGFEIRNEYESTVLKMNQSSFAYFENQYVGDHHFAMTLFSACKPKITPSWCENDNFAFFVIPYVPGGPGIKAIDDNLVVPQIIKEEAQNLIWLEVKTAKSVRLRPSNTLFRTLNHPNPAAGGCIPNMPYIKFVNTGKLHPDEDPGDVTLDTFVEIRGNDPNQPCPNAPGFTVQTLPVRKKVRDIITDSGIMSYVLATDHPAPGPPPANYNAYLQANGIYIHSKHSEFWLPGTGGVPLTPSLYVVGSANLNTRSLGNTPKYPKQVDWQDSEDAIFWEPTDRDDFYRQIWKEHTLIDYIKTPKPLGNMQFDWRSQGWKNYDALHAPKPGALQGRVVRLDNVERCLSAVKKCM